MVISKLLGGLGNQLFQYAFGYSIAKSQGLDYYYDDSAFESYTLRDFKLSSFNISAKSANKRQLASTQSLLSYKRIINLQLTKLEIIREPKFTFCEEIFDKKNIGYYEGYWQSEKYFKNFSADLVNEYKVKKPLLEKNAYLLNKILIDNNSVSLHVRRGDYAKNKHTMSVHGLMGIEYYNKAIELIKSKIERPVFYIFSDEIDWVKSNFNFQYEKVIFLEGNQGIHDIDDFLLMQSCRHHVLANSTFSWWAAWLGEKTYSEKLIIAPTQWFADSKMDSSDLIPERWLRI